MPLLRTESLLGNLLLLSILISNVSLSHIYVNATSPSIPQQSNNLVDSLSFDLGPYVNNKAFGEGADLDGMGTFFSGDSFQRSSLLINNSTCNSAEKGFDNIKVNDQMAIPLQIGSLTSLGALYTLVSATHGPLTAKITVSYTDKTQDSTILSLPDWQDALANQIERNQAVHQPLSNGNKSAMFSVPIYVNPVKKLAQLHLLQDQKKEPSDATLRVFSLVGYSTQSKLVITSVQATHEWINTSEQVIIVRVHNIGAEFIRNASIHVSGQVNTVKASEYSKGKHDRSNCTRFYSYDTRHAKYIGLKGKTMSTLTKANVLLKSSPGTYKATPASVQKHRSPTWLKQAKFGIFIHWGLYSIPAWAPVGKAYAEWYWWRMNHQDDPAFAYHRDTYGADVEYDQFLNQWHPTQFDPRVWLDLIDQSRAKYYVFTTKHHDGIALFDTNVTDRSTVKLLQPNRDFVRDFMHISEQVYPHLKRGLYFSLPEWYHPKYNDNSLGWHGSPVNPYTDKRVAYTGSKTINDFVNELQVPQFQELVYNYSPDIIWCDIGDIHNSSVWPTDYFNRALQQGRSVAVNDRCGDGSASDFTTVEYKAVVDTPTRFWEATRGMDPYSFGFNRETKPEEYASTNDLLENLVDADSRGGNFLLNIGPEASGKVPEPMVKRLLEIGQWLDLVGGAIFESVPYWVTSNERNLRFTVSETGKSVYVFAFPLNNTIYHQQITVQTPLPIEKGTNISLLNHKQVKVSWRYDAKGHFMLEFDLLQSKDSESILVFEISST